MTTKVDKQLTALELAQPYAELALELAKEIKGVKSLQDKLEAKKGGVWGGFKRALAIGMAAGHTAANIKAGLAVACEEAKIPSGSFRGYVGTIGHMYNEIAEGTLTLSEAENMSIGDARKRYRKPKAEPSESGSGEESSASTASSVSETVNPLVRHVLERIKDWDDASLTVLLGIIDDITTESVEDALEELSEAA